ncbi:hypothetical protein [Vallitalea maricola]|uniref:Uncharacterized protein n=1 Tax=Vallitalea maricola TaxID=3074433 RepID=A0ACB5UF50_9FIRM|nr:hypothetical protein AN2V17_04160 [Vallitalea sp. AN17-2]
MKDVIAKERRDTILEILQANSPHGVGEKVITSLVNEAGYEMDNKTVIQDIFYLKDKGFIATSEVKNSQYGMKRYISNITAKGIDYLEGVR